MSDHLLIERTGEVATLVINRQDSRNALSLQVYRDLPGLLAELDADTGVKVLVVRGAGERAFAAGADISEFQEVRGNAESAKTYNEHVAAAENALESFSKPTVAMIHGYCIGGGFGLALACDLRFGDERSRFAITPAKLGLVYSLESTKRLVDLVGPARAKWVLYSGEQIPAERARDLGIIDELYAGEDLERETYEFCDLITTRAQFSVRASKQIVGRIVGGQSEDDEHTTFLRNSSFDTDDYAEGVSAFLAKRSPEFTWS